MIGSQSPIATTLRTESCGNGRLRSNHSAPHARTGPCNFCRRVESLIGGQAEALAAIKDRRGILQSHVEQMLSLMMVQYVKRFRGLQSVIGGQAQSRSRRPRLCWSSRATACSL